MESDPQFEDVGFVPVSERPEWAGITPLHPPPSVQPVVSIAAAPADADLMACFWAGLQAGELSQRMLDLTEEAILEYNSAHYSVWEWRWRCIQALGGIEAHAEGEADLTRRVATDNPKNYQLWNHRRRCALALGRGHAAAEDDFSAACLAHDAKNYHAWAHRQAVIAAFGGGAWLGELAFTEHLLREDALNNSAWNQRMFVVRNAPEAVAGPAAELRRWELAFVRGKLALAARNEAAWAYLRGLAAAPGAPPAALAAEPAFKEICLEALRGDPTVVPALELLADVYAAQAQLLRSQEGAAKTQAAAAKAAGLATGLFEKLQVADPIRAAYYRHRCAQVASRC